MRFVGLAWTVVDPKRTYRSLVSRVRGSIRPVLLRLCHILPARVSGLRASLGPQRKRSTGNCPLLSARRIAGTARSRRGGDYRGNGDRISSGVRILFTPHDRHAPRRGVRCRTCRDRQRQYAHAGQQLKRFHVVSFSSLPGLPSAAVQFASGRTLIIPAS